jgi:hypothetical protein
MLEIKRRGPVILKTDSKELLQKLCRPIGARKEPVKGKQRGPMKRVDFGGPVA